MLFPPQLNQSEARQQLHHIVNQRPENFQQTGCRWTLESIRNSVGWLKELSLSGVWRHLKRVRISRKHARGYVRSPDLQYLAKLAEIVRVLELATQANGRVIVLFADEFTFYRQPSLAFAYSRAKTQIQPRARFSHQENTTGRIGGLVNAISGQVTYEVADKCGTDLLIKLYEQVCQTYPEADVIYIVEDNWPVHFHPDVLASLVEQETEFELKIPPSWRKVKAQKWEKEKLPIQILPLPTYASWCNPIEKLWRWLKQEVIHLHRYANDWEGLQQEIKKFLDKFRQESAELLKYIGLTENSKLYGEAISLLREKPT